MKTEIKIKKLSKQAITPTYGTEFAAGADLYACIKEPIDIKSGETKMIPTGIAMEIPDTNVGLIFARSGLAAKKGLAPANKVGVIDADYRGEIMVALHNHSTTDATIQPDERIAQLMITPFVTAIFETVDELSDTVRNTGGFGSTGQK